jgi:predicted house-cleaning noncanonical NTP pyrophosphatase (MazG superfamily)
MRSLSQDLNVILLETSLTVVSEIIANIYIVLVAEIVKHFVPHIVELHNYSAAHSVSQKTYNWNTLNQKLFKKLGFTLTKKDMEDAVNCVPDTIERILRVLQLNIANYQERKAKKAANMAEGNDSDE